MPKRVTSPATRPAADRSAAAGTGAAHRGAGASRPSTDASGVIAPLNSALPPLADDPTIPGTARDAGGHRGPAAGAGHGGGTGPAPAPGGVAPGEADDGDDPGDGGGSVPGDGTTAGGRESSSRTWPPPASGATGDGPAVEPPGPGDAASDVAPDRGARTGGRGSVVLRRPRTWVAAAVVAAVVGMGAWGGVVLAGDNGIDSARSAVLAVAAHDITVLSTYDYRHLNHDDALARQIMTPAEWRSYDKAGATVRATIVKDKAVATAKVLAVGVVRATSGRVVVLAAVQQTIDDNLLSAPATLPRQYEFTFVPVGGRWRVDYVEQL